LTRAAWQDLIFLEDTASIKHRASFSAGASRGIGNGVTRVLTRGDTSFSYPGIALSNPKDVGNSSFTSNEFIRSIKNPASTSFNLNLDSYSLALLGNSFFQGGTQTSPAGGVYLYTMIPYTSSTPTKFLSAAKAMSLGDLNADTTSEELYGGIITSLNISGAIGEVLSVNGSFKSVGYNRTNVLGEISNDPRLCVMWGQQAASTDATVYRENGFDTWVSMGTFSRVAADANFTNPSSLSAGTVEQSIATGNLNFSSADLVSYSGVNIRVSYDGLNRDAGISYDDLSETITSHPTPLKFQDMFVNLGGSLISVSNISISLSSQTSFNYHHGQEALSFTLGRINGSLSLTIPWSDTVYGSMEAFYNYMKSTEHYIQVYWGATSPISENQVNIRMNGKLTKYNKVDGQGEVSLNITFDLVENDSYEAIEFLVAYSSSKLSRA